MKFAWECRDQVPIARNFFLYINPFLLIFVAKYYVD